MSGLNSWPPPRPAWPGHQLYPGVVLPSSGFGGRKSLLSPAYICQARINCLPLFMQKMPCDLDLDFESAGRSIAARIAMMAMTTSSSISVKPRRRFSRVVPPFDELKSFMCLSPKGYFDERLPKRFGNVNCAFWGTGEGSFGTVAIAAGSHSPFVPNSSCDFGHGHVFYFAKRT